MLNIPYVQQKITILVAEQLSAKLGTELTIGRIDLGFLNRIIVDDLNLKDQAGKEMLKVTRLSVKINIIPLFQKKISINNIQLFGFNVNMEKKTVSSKPNFQFIIDKLASKDTVRTERNFDLRINSLLMRRGKVAYNVLSEKQTPGIFNPQHLRFQNIIANISLKVLQKDSINASIKRFSVEEESSKIELKKLSLKVLANEKQMSIENFKIALPNTRIELDTIKMKYNGFRAYQNFADSVQFSLHILPSDISLSDFSAFVPALSGFKEQLHFKMDANGSFNRLNCSKLSINIGHHFILDGNMSLQDLSRPKDSYIYGNLSKLYIDQEEIAFIFKNLSKEYKGVPPELQRLGTLLFHGELSGYFNELVAYGVLRTDVGILQTDVKLSSNKAESYFAYSGLLKTVDFDLGRVLNNPKVGKISFNLEVEGNQYAHKYPFITLKGLISSLCFSDYIYHDIALDGEYKQGGFNGNVSLDDENGTIVLDGAINTASRIPTFNFRADIRHFRPHNLHLTKHHEKSSISVNMEANFTGASIDEMDGEISIDSLEILSSEKNYFLDHFIVSAARKNSKQKSLNITSNFIQAKIEGNYSYRTLPASIKNILSHYLPSLVKSNNKQTDNNFDFDVHIYNTDILPAVFNIPLEIKTHSTLSGSFNDKAHRMRIEGYFPRLIYDNKLIESGILLCENPNDVFRTHLRFNNIKQSEIINVSLEGLAKNDSVQTTLNWGNNNLATYSGKLAAIASFIVDKKNNSSRKAENLKTIIDIKSTDIILNDTLWQISPSQISLNRGKIYVNNFNFSHGDRHLNIDGVISDQVQDTLRLNLRDINIGYIFDIADLGVNFSGEATGPAYASSILNHPVMYADLSIRNLGLNNALLGDANIHGEWHQNVEGLYLDAHVNEKNIAKSHVYGYIYPLKPKSSLDLQIEADNTNLKFLEYYLTSLTPEFNGRASGRVHLYGKFKTLALDGRVLGNASMKVSVLNTTFFLKDSIRISPDGLEFSNNSISDPYGNQGKVSGYLQYEHFKNMKYRFHFDYKNMLLMNTKESPEYSFYGTVYGTGNALIQGNSKDGVNIDVAMTTNRNTNFVYMKEGVASATNNQFIKFIDKTPKRAVQDSVQLSTKKNPQEERDTDIRLNLQIEATPNAAMKIIMDPIAGDYISGKGSGNIRAEFFNKGDLKMFGSYRISQGIYKFSLQEIIRKDFTIKDGSSISFNGSPSNANMDINAKYTVNSVSLNDLVPNASGYVNQTNLKVNCTMAITGQLTSPDIKLGIELPNERDEVQALIRNYIPTDEQMNMQILYLLSIGKFYTPENVETTQSSNMMSSVLSSTLSGQFNNALSHIIDSNNWNVGTNLSTGERGWTDFEFESMLSGQLLNNRLLVNGNFGYRDNPLANTNFVGDFEAEWLVNRSGDIRLKAYSETNDRYYAKTNLTTQGIGIIFRKDFTKWNELIFWNKWKLKRLKSKAENKNDTLNKDSISTFPSRQESRAKAKAKEKRGH